MLSFCLYTIDVFRAQYNFYFPISVVKIILILFSIISFIHSLFYKMSFEIINNTPYPVNIGMSYHMRCKRHVELVAYNIEYVNTDFRLDTVTLANWRFWRHNKYFVYCFHLKTLSKGFKKLSRRRNRVLFYFTDIIGMMQRCIDIHYSFRSLWLHLSEMQEK